MAVFQTITINDEVLPYPNDFQMKKVPNIVNEMVTLSGKTIADVNGWKYDDTTLKWDTLLDQDLQRLLSAISVFQFEVTFSDISGTKTVEAILKNRTNVKTPMFHNGTTVWKDVAVTLSFPDCYHSIGG